MTENQLLNLTRQYVSIANTLKNMPDVQLVLNDGSVYDLSLIHILFYVYTRRPSS